MVSPEAMAWGQIKSTIKSAVKSTVAFSTAAVNAVASNHAGGLGRGNPNDFGEHATAASYGQRTGDALSVFMGAQEMVTGGNMMAGAVVAEGATLGLSTVAVAGAGVLTAEGYNTASQGMKNLLNPTKVEAKGNKSDAKRIEKIKERQAQVKHTTSKSKATNDKHTKVRSGERAGDNRNNSRGNKNQKYKQKPNPNKRST